MMVLQTVAILMGLVTLVLLAVLMAAAVMTPLQAVFKVHYDHAKTAADPVKAKVERLPTVVTHQKIHRMKGRP